MIGRILKQTETVAQNDYSLSLAFDAKVTGMRASHVPHWLLGRNY